MSIKIHKFDTDSNKKTTETKIVILIKELSWNLEEIHKTYVEPLVSMGIPVADISAISLQYLNNNKCPVKLQKQNLDNLLPTLKWIKAEILLIADPNYFKTIMRKRKVDASYGYAADCKYPGYEDFTGILSINFAALFYNPKLQNKIDKSLNTVCDFIHDTYQDPGTGIIRNCYYPDTLDTIAEALEKLHRYPNLTCDIETFSLQLHKAKIGSISFAWNQHEGVAFSVKHGFAVNHLYSAPLPREIYILLRAFFRTYKGTLIYHGGTFDIKILIYELFMKNPLDKKGMLKGLEIMTKNTHDTKLIAYLATNTTAGNQLSLKQLAQEFAGDYAQSDIKDITVIATKDLLEYNLVDCLSTWWVYNKYHPIMLNDQQEQIYKEIFLPSMKVIIQMELVGMPIDLNKVREASAALWTQKDKYADVVNTSTLIWQYDNILRTEALIDKNTKLKKKVMYERDFVDVMYNPASNHQTRHLLHDIWGFDVLDTTDSGLAAVGSATLKKHLNALIHKYDITDEELHAND